MANSNMDVDSDSFDDWTALRNAVILQQPTSILNLLKQDIDFRCTDNNGNTVLHMVFEKYAFNKNQTLIITILDIFLDYGMDPNVINNEGKTALHLAIKSRLCDVIDFLMTRGANLNVCDKDGDSIAHFVVDNEFDQFCRIYWSEKYTANENQHAQNKSKHFLRWLLSKGLNVNYRNNDGLIPLHLAAQLNLQYIMLELLNYTKNIHVNYVNRNNQNILHSLFESFGKPIGLKNEKKSVNIPFRENQAILTIIELLLNMGISVDTVDNNGSTPLHLALKLAETDVINLLITKFSNVNACDSDGNTVLHIALIEFRNYNLDIYSDYVKILLFKGADVRIKNKDGLEPLQIAVLKQSMPMMQILKHYNANFHIIHDSGNLLHLFATNRWTCNEKTNFKSAIDLLVSKGCDVNSRNEFGMTPLHLALRSCNVHIVEGLIERGADMRAQELFQHKYTTLHLAAIYGYEDHIDMFIKAGVDVNAQDANGQTPLHLASNNAKILKTCLCLGAHVDQYDHEGKLPLHMAIQSENLDSVTILLHYGTDIEDINTRKEVESLIIRNEIDTVIIKHWMKLENAHLPVDKAFKDWIDTYYKTTGSSFHNDELMQFRRLCATEIQSLKERKIVDNVSWYDFLHMNRNRQCVFVQANNIKEESFDFVFPTYQPVISGAYYQAKARIPLLQLAVSAWYELTNHYLPDICVEHIYSYLSNANLRNVIKSMRNRNG